MLFSQFTSTQSTFVLSAGPVDLTATFLSPVEVRPLRDKISSTFTHVEGSSGSVVKPNDLVKQSLPFSYLSLTAKSTDGKSHSVQLYSDTSAEWVSGDTALAVNWTTTTSQGEGGLLAHQAQLQEPKNYEETQDQIQRELSLCLPPSHSRVEIFLPWVSNTFE